MPAKRPKPSKKPVAAAPPPKPIARPNPPAAPPPRVQQPPPAAMTPPTGKAFGSPPSPPPPALPTDLPVQPTPAKRPRITTQPSDQTVTAGQHATFTVAVDGMANPAYQWRKNGREISDATSPAFTASAADLEDSGSEYDVVVTDQANAQLISQSATLTVRHKA